MLSFVVGVLTLDPSGFFVVDEKETDFATDELPSFEIAFEQMLGPTLSLFNFLALFDEGV